MMRVFFYLPPLITIDDEQNLPPDEEEAVEVLKDVEDVRDGS